MTVTRYAIQRAVEGGDFMAYDEADGSLMGIDVDPTRAFAKLMRKIHLRDKMAALPVGARAQIYEGMGNTAYGIITSRLTGDGRIGFKYDGSVNPDGERNEPFEMYINIDAVNPDPDGDMARENVSIWKPGYMRIEATL